MDTLWAAFHWLMVHQPPFPWSLICVVFGTAMTAWLVAGCAEGDEDYIVPPFVISALVLMFSAIGAADSKYWYHFVSLGIGWIGIPLAFGALFGIFAMARGGVRKAWNTARSGWNFVASRLTAWRKAKAAEAEARRKAEEKSPEHVMAECQAVLDAYRAQLPKDIAAPEAMRRAGDLLEALGELFKLDDHLAKLSPGDEKALAEKVGRADQIFADVSLEQECPDLITKLRGEHHAIGPVRKRIHSAIEAIVLLIKMLPDRLASKMALEVPSEYRQVVDDLRQTDGRSLLPDLAPDPPVSAPVPQRRRQTA